MRLLGQLGSAMSENPRLKSLATVAADVGLVGGSDLQTEEAKKKFFEQCQHKR